MNADSSTHFFSYAREDSDFVLKLANDLRIADAKLWLDQLDIRGGERWDRAVETALERCGGMIIVLSPDSVDSPNVLDEVSYALEEQKLVIPLLYRECKIPFRLRRLQFIDFTADFDKGFSHLARAMHLDKPAIEPALGSSEKSSERVVEAASKQASEGTLPFETEERTNTPQTTTPSIEKSQRDSEEKLQLSVRDAQSDESRGPTQQERLKGTIIGVLLATIVLVVSMYYWRAVFLPFRLNAILIAAIVVTFAGGAIAGALSGTHKLRAVAALLGSALGWLVVGFIFFSFDPTDPASVVAGLYFGASPGAIIGAIAGEYYRKNK